MILDEFLLLAAPSTRTKAYLQIMVQNNLYPSLCIIMVEDIEKLEEEKYQVWEAKSDKEFFNENEPILLTLERSNIPYISVSTADINAKLLSDTLQEQRQKYVIYSGYGGAILKPNLFLLGKKFIHIHAGDLPAYRGSTTAYYSILKDKSIAATAIFMNEKIDEGGIIVKKTYPAIAQNIDYIYEPYIRALVLVEALKIYIDKNDFLVETQDSSIEETYYIIHPVLKHLAILLLQNKESREK